MDDLISRQAVHSLMAMLLSDYLHDEDREKIELIDAKIAELPSVTPKEKTGHWIALDECSNSGYYCSECHKKVIKEGWSDTIKKLNYCPNCGAKMVEPQECEDKVGDTDGNS